MHAMKRVTCVLHWLLPELGTGSVRAMGIQGFVATPRRRAKKNITAARSVRNPDCRGLWKFVPQKCRALVQFSVSEEE